MAGIYCVHTVQSKQQTDNRTQLGRRFNSAISVVEFKRSAVREKKKVNFLKTKQNKTKQKK